MTQPEWMLTLEQFRAIDDKTFKDARDYMAVCKAEDKLILETVIRKIHHNGDTEKCKAQAHKILVEIEKQMLHKPNDELFVSNGCYLISIGNWEQFQKEVGNG